MTKEEKRAYMREYYRKRKEKKIKKETFEKKVTELSNLGNNIIDTSIKIRKVMGMLEHDFKSHIEEYELLIEIKNELYTIGKTLQE